MQVRSGISISFSNDNNKINNSFYLERSFCVRKYVTCISPSIFRGEAGVDFSIRYSDWKPPGSEGKGVPLSYHCLGNQHFSMVSTVVNAVGFTLPHRTMRGVCWADWGAA